MNSTKSQLSSPISDRNLQRSWYALYTRSRCEKKLYNALSKNNYHAFLPLVKEKRQWSDRIKTIEVPLLPGYLFVNISSKQVPDMYYFPWMVNYVMHEGKPATIRPEEISILEYTINNNLKIHPIKDCQIGDEAKITSGPFKGMTGRVTKKGNGCKVILTLESIDQQFCVELNSREIN